MNYNRQIGFLKNVSQKAWFIAVHTGMACGVSCTSFGNTSFPNPHLQKSPKNCVPPNSSEPGEFGKNASAQRRPTLKSTHVSYATWLPGVSARIPYAAFLPK